MKKIISVFLILIILLSIFSTNLFVVDASTTEFAGGSGTKSDPFLITNKTHLNNVRNYSVAHFKLMSDIEFDHSDFTEIGIFYNDGAGFEPIGKNENSPFLGTFDGNGYIIKNISINTEYAGLFGYNNGTIKNLGMVDENITAASSSNAHLFAGGIAGYNKGTIINCYNTGNVYLSNPHKPSSYVGGIVGYNEGTITNCYNKGTVTGLLNIPIAGGIVGRNNGTIINCYNAGEVAASASSISYSNVGGIAGDNINFSTIENCYNIGKVTGSYGRYAGGIVGENEGTITNCYNTGTLETTYYSYTGGIAGVNSYIIENCYNIGEMTTYCGNTGGIAGTIGFIIGVNEDRYGTITNCYYVDKQFTDVPSDKWYVKSINYAVAYGIFSGTSDTTFEPNTSLTRGMFVTVLSRISGADINNDVTTKFKDVAKGKWYTGAVKWANDNGIVNGLTETQFGTNENITREQMCTMLIRFAEFAKITLKNTNAKTTFADDSKISKWAKDAVYACQAANIVNGSVENGKSVFKPRGNATRAEASKILSVFHQDYM